MDETTREIISSITVKSEDERVLPGGHKGFVYYDTPNLSPSQLSRLAATAMWEDQHVDFDIIVGMAYRGVLFAAAIAGGKPVSIYQHDGEIFGACVKDKRIILVDDVIVSGKTILEAKLELEKLGAKVVALACIVDRSIDGFQRDLALPLVSAFRTVLE
jgi:orotate phosphoribosyltransferase